MVSVFVITSRQRARLRAIANGIDTIFQIGKGGINDNLIRQIDDALKAREIIKLRILESSGYEAREACDEICARVGAEGVQVIGSRMVIYRENSEKKQIFLD